jgi:hypothetical protein
MPWWSFNRQTLNTEESFQSQASPRGIYGESSDTETGFSPSTSVYHD